MRFISGYASDFSKAPFLKMRLGTSEGPTGHVGFIIHKQPELERALRDAAAMHDCCQFRSRSKVESIEEDEDYVTVGYTDATGLKRELRAPLIVGADGKTGFVRKNYLEPKDIVMESSQG